MKTTIIKVLLSTSMLFFSASTFADHHEAGEEKAKTVIGYDTTEGTRADLYAGSVSYTHLRAHET